MTTLVSLDTFAESFPKHEDLDVIVPLYLVLRDLTVKNQLNNVKHVRGLQWGVSEYVIEGIHKLTSVKRIFLPIPFEADVDLIW